MPTVKKLTLTLSSELDALIISKTRQRPDLSYPRIVTDALYAHFAAELAKVKPERQMPDPETNLPEELRNLMKDWPE
jgi:hypothetical protein